MLKVALCIFSCGLISFFVRAEDTAVCEQKIIYDIYINGFHTGELQRQIIQKGAELSFLTRSNMSILGIGTTFYQTSNSRYESQQKRYFTSEFYQVMTGFRNRTMKVNISANGLDSHVLLNDKITKYRSKQYLLQDMDTIIMQLQLNVRLGKTHFYTLRQATDEMELFEYQVVGKETLSTQNFGDLETIKVVEIQDRNVTFWFAPSLNYLMIKATNIKGWVLKGTTELKTYTDVCV
ncbi:DUF3108 domain-containing protein [Moritella marina ATCC 15381]|uniref:DUF3108 domain-containing protein n=1 Tax=Moritella marina ATCC 15381 TaxID=1202962 RepID=A0A5J6WFU2_MORMI|nr:DUF3108 domain-containing protein [Moritella marina]QFI36883.1 DUF3108 domain-containing protein [Moritella marina ATCC 15381]